MQNSVSLRITCSLLFSLCFFVCRAQTADTNYVRNNYDKFEYQVPVRDGIKLFTSVYVPKDKSQKYPIMLQRTPYSCRPYGKTQVKPALGPSEKFMTDKFIFVYQDVRGRWMSEGIYEEMTPHIDHKKSKKQVDEASDTYDTIDWLLKNVKGNNGKVGIWGISYPGFYTTAGILSKHPALVCASPQAPIADLYRDDAFHNGAFMLAANFGFYPFFTNRQNDKPTQGTAGDFDFGTQDGYAFYLKMGATGNSNKLYFKDTIRLWNEMLEHPDYDEHWKNRNILNHLSGIKHTAILTTGGWYDAEDLYGSFKTYAGFEKANPGIRNYFVVGPWVHGGWARGDGDHLGDIDFGAKNSAWYQENIEFPFFSHYLKGTPDPQLPEATAFETGTNTWKKFSAWPPKEMQSRKLYFHAGGKLSFDAPSEASARDSFISDPAKPVPFINETDLDMKREYMTADQRFAAQRPDVLVYQTDILSEDLTLAGNIWADLRISTSGTDADWIVKVIDVYPDSAKNNAFTRQDVYMSSYQQMVRSEAMRGRFRNGFDKPEPFSPGKIENVKFELQDVLHTFKKGHRLMVQVQSSWFPLIDRNPQTFVPNIFFAKPGDYRKATHTLYADQAHPSCLEVGVLPR